MACSAALVLAWDLAFAAALSTAARRARSSLTAGILACGWCRG